MHDTHSDDAHDTLILKGIELCLQHLDNLTAALAANASVTGAAAARGGSNAKKLRVVINMSIGRPARHEVFASGLRHLISGRDDVLLFASAGNSGSAALRFPAA